MISHVQFCDPMDCSMSGSMGFSRQEYWSGLPFPSPGNLPRPGIKPVFPALAGRFFTTESPGKCNYPFFFLPICDYNSSMIWAKLRIKFISWFIGPGPQKSVYLRTGEKNSENSGGIWCCWQLKSQVCLQAQGTASTMAHTAMVISGLSSKLFNSELPAVTLTSEPFLSGHKQC